MEQLFRVAILDDYTRTALSMADWNQLGADVKVSAFHDHIGAEEQVVARLEPFDALVSMRERTSFPESTLSRLPNLQLLVTPGPYNAAIDMRAAARLGIKVSGLKSPESAGVS